MNNESEWENEKTWWIEAGKGGLYPPEKITKVQGALELIEDENFVGKKVLDNGCGTGWFGKIIQERGANVIGTDISEPLLEEAKSQIKVTKASSYRLPFENQSFDYVISLMVIHVLAFPERALSEIYRVLKPRGKLYLGIVHPKAEKWDEKTGLCFVDMSTYDSIENRPWVFNLLDGRRFTKHYIHRPLSYYENELAKRFTVSKKLEPKFADESTQKGKYATTEYLFLELVRD